MKVITLAIAAASIATAGTASAATVVWNTPTNDTGKASDVINAGTLIAARTVGQSTTVNGVTFTSGFGGTMQQSGAEVTTSAYSGAVFADAAYNALIGTGAYTSTRGNVVQAIEMTGLTVGARYMFQAFTPSWNANWATTFTGGTSTSANVNLTGGDVGAGISAVPQNLVGYFTADATSQKITLGSPTNVAILAAAQLRTADVAQAVPEPASWAMMLLGFGMIGATARRRHAASRLAHA